MNLTRVQIQHPKAGHTWHDMHKLGPRTNRVLYNKQVLMTNTKTSVRLYPYIEQSITERLRHPAKLVVNPNTFDDRSGCKGFQLASSLSLHRNCFSYHVSLTGVGSATSVTQKAKRAPAVAAAAACPAAAVPKGGGRQGEGQLAAPLELQHPAAPLAAAWDLMPHTSARFDQQTAM